MRRQGGVMHDLKSGHLQELKVKSEQAAAVVAEHETRRREMVDRQYQLQALELQVRQAAAEVEQLEGFSLTRLLSGLSGGRKYKAEQARAALERLEDQYDAASEALDALTSRVGELERQSQAAQDARARYEAACAERLQAASARGDESAARIGDATQAVTRAKEARTLVEKAIEAGNEARRDLLGEIETLSTMGRCRVAEGHRAITAIMNTALKGTVEQCAGRVRTSVRRFARHFGDAVRSVQADANDEVTALQSSLQRIGSELGGPWFQRDGEDSDSSGHVNVVLQSADLYLDVLLQKARQQTAQAEAEQRRLAEQIL